MNKIKKLWIQNRVLFVLFVIIFVCLLLILGVFLKYFFGAASSSYGDRLDGIKEVEITDDLKTNFITSLQNEELVQNVSMNTKGKIIYISITFKDEVSLVEAQSIAQASLQFFEEKYLNFYDFQYTLKGNKTEDSEGFLIMGARNVNGTKLSWNNNTEVKKEE